MKRMSFAAPIQSSRTHPDGTWSHHSWTKEEVLEYKENGGWFVKGRHHFEDQKAAIAAGVSNE